MFPQKSGIVVCCAVLAQLVGGASTLADTCADKAINISVNPAVYAYLPFYVGVEKGFFADEGLQLNVIKYSGSATTQLPMLARGDLDISPTVLGTAFFNQFAEGFNVKIIASVQEAKAGWHDSTWILVRKGIADKVVNFGDLKGLRIDGGPQGSPIMQLTKLALAAGGLTKNDVTYTEKFRAPPDFFGAFRNDAVDVLSAPEPVATQLETEGLAVRWKSISDIKPGWQELFLGASPDYVKTCPAETTKFLRAFLRAADFVAKAGPHWTPEIKAIASKWTGLPEATLAGIGGPTYVGQLGAVDMDNVAYQYEFWRKDGSIRGTVEIADIVDMTALREAKKAQ